MKAKTNDSNDIPIEFAAALKASGLTAFFAGCTGSHRLAYLRWIGEAKKSETRISRSQQAMKRLAVKRAQQIKKSPGS